MNHSCTTVWWRHCLVIFISGDGEKGLGSLSLFPPCPGVRSILLSLSLVRFPPSDPAGRSTGWGCERREPPHSGNHTAVSARFFYGRVVLTAPVAHRVVCGEGAASQRGQDHVRSHEVGKRGCLQLSYPTLNTMCSVNRKENSNQLKSRLPFTSTSF